MLLEQLGCTERELYEEYTVATLQQYAAFQRVKQKLQQAADRTPASKPVSVRNRGGAVVFNPE